MTPEVTPEYAEKYVREKWERVVVCADYNPPCDHGVFLFNYANRKFHKCSNWLDAYAYTLEHEEKIRQKREEIEQIKEAVEGLTEHCEYWRSKVYERLLAVLESQLAELLLGFNE